MSNHGWNVDLGRGQPLVERTTSAPRSRSGLRSSRSWRATNPGGRPTPAEKNAEVAQRNEVRSRFGWAITLHPHRDQYELRNLGTLAAHDVKRRLEIDEIRGSGPKIMGELRLPG